MTRIRYYFVLFILPPVFIGLAVYFIYIRSSKIIWYLKNGRREKLREEQNAVSAEPDFGSRMIRIIAEIVVIGYAIMITKTWFEKI